MKKKIKGNSIEGEIVVYANVNLSAADVADDYPLSSVISKRITYSLSASMGGSAVLNIQHIPSPDVEDIIEAAHEYLFELIYATEEGEGVVASLLRKGFSL